MKYKEFREYLTLNEISLKEDKESLIADDHIEISKTEEHKIVFLIDVIDFQYEFEMLKKAIELAETPLDERVDVKKCYLKHRFINNFTAEKYINLLKAEKVILSTRVEEQNYKTKFTKAEIEELKVEFDTDFNDFELIEAED